MALLNEINVKGVPHPIVTDDGYYQEMTVGDAEQLVATTFTEDDAPYNFRTAGGAIDIGDRKQVEGIVGGTVAWNQKLPTNFISSKTENGITITNNGDGSYTVNGTATALFDVYNTVRVLDGHIYCLTGVPSGSSNDTYYMYFGTKRTQDALYKVTGDGHTSVDIVVINGVSVNNVVFKPQVFDLTQMFGSTIADYIYSLEQANAGSGVAWFKKYFPKDYYAYDAGELMSVKALRHITRGFNAFDGELELGAIPTDTGQNYASSGEMRSVNYIPCLPNTQYFYHTEGSWASFRFYDADKGYLGASTAVGKNPNTLFSTPSNAYYMRFVYKATTPADICINLSWDGERDGEYEEYVEHIYELDSDLELRGIPKLSTGNDLYYDGDVYEPDGTVTRKYGILTITTNDVSLPNNVYENIQYARIAKPSDSIALGKAWTRAINTKFIASGANNDWDTADKVNGFFGGADYQWYWFGFAAGTTLEQAKTALAGTVIVYELAEPTEETADSYNGTQIVDDFGTEEFVDAGVAGSTRDVSIPVGHNSLYQPNLRAKLEMAPNSPEDNGYYVVYHHDGINEYVPLIIPQELPNLPSEDGTYVLKCTVASGSATLSFESEV